MINKQERWSGIIEQDRGIPAGKRHVFLYGDVGVGKSTLIDSVLAKTGLSVCGFRTGFDERRAQVDRNLYLYDAAGPATFKPEHSVVRFYDGGRDVDIERWNTLGCSLLEGRFGAQIRIMDECSFLEQEAELFCRRVLDCLEEPLPVLGVVRPAKAGWVGKIMDHPAVWTIQVTLENRDGLVPVLVRHFHGHMMELQEQKDTI